MKKEQNTERRENPQNQQKIVVINLIENLNIVS